MATHHVAKILMSGGGSGGHITPLLAIADELKRQQPDCVVVSVGERGGTFAHLTEQHQSIDGTRTIFAGKLRRYHGESWLRRLVDVRTILLNVRDAFYVLIGCVQAVVLIRRERPDVVFLKGGFVGVPIGLAAALWRVPTVTHDSDALVGLANRLAGRWARVHATGMPAEYYPYKPRTVRYVGVLVGAAYNSVSPKQQQVFRRELGLAVDGTVLLVTGGSLGSQRLNAAFVASVEALLAANPDLSVVHQVGKGNKDAYGSYSNPRLTVLEFLDGMHRYSGAADLIVTRAGANAIAEFGVQGRACVVVPSPFLSGGHQLKNAAYLQAQDAARIVDESAMLKDPAVLATSIEELLHDAKLRDHYAQRLRSITVPDAAEQLAAVLLEVASKK